MSQTASENLIDRPRALRDEDAFDVEALDAWLKQRVEGLEGTPEVEVTE